MNKKYFLFVLILLTSVSCNSLNNNFHQDNCSFSEQIVYSRPIEEQSFTDDSSNSTSDIEESAEEIDANSGNEENASTEESANQNSQKDERIASCPNVIFSQHILKNTRIGYDFDGLNYCEAYNRISTNIIQPLDYDLMIKANKGYKFKVFVFPSIEMNKKSPSHKVVWTSRFVVPSSSSFVLVISKKDDSTIEEYNNPLQFDFNFDYLIDSKLNVSKIKKSFLGRLKYHQSFCSYNGYYYSTNGKSVAIQDKDFNVVNNKDMDLGHGNSFQIGNDKYAYVSGWDDNKVYILDLESLEIFKTVCLPTSGYTTVAVDEGNNLFYIFQRDTEPCTYSTYNVIVFDYFNNEIKNIERTDLFLYAQQSTVFKDGLFYLSAGLGRYYGGVNYYLWIDCEFNIVSSLVLNSFQELEPEGLFYDGKKFLVSFVDRSLYEIEIINLGKNYKSCK